jgi:hypothetical protein
MLALLVVGIAACSRPVPRSDAEPGEALPKLEGCAAAGRFGEGDVDSARRELAAFDADFRRPKLLSESVLGHRGPSPLLRGLGRAEVAAIYAYKRSAYAEVNRALRAGAYGPVASFVRILCSALGQLPEWQGVAFRGSALPANVFASYVPGALVSEAAFLSSSPSRSVAELYLRRERDPAKQRVLFRIESLRGRLIDDGNESELLFAAGSRFRVQSTQPVSGEGGLPAHVLIELAEIGP